MRLSGFAPSGIASRLAADGVEGQAGGPERSEGMIRSDIDLPRQHYAPPEAVAGRTWFPSSTAQKP